MYLKLYKKLNIKSTYNVKISELRVEVNGLNDMRKWFIYSSLDGRLSTILID